MDFARRRLLCRLLHARVVLLDSHSCSVCLPADHRPESYSLDVPGAVCLRVLLGATVADFLWLMFTDRLGDTGFGGWCSLIVDTDDGSISTFVVILLATCTSSRRSLWSSCSILPRTATYVFGWVARTLAPTTSPDKLLLRFSTSLYFIF